MSNIAMQRIPDAVTLRIEAHPNAMQWRFCPPSDWDHLRTDDKCLAFYRTPDGLQIGVNAFYWDTGVVWIHASCTRRDSLPTYEDLCALKAAVWPDGFAAQVFVPPADHVNIHPNCLHLWGPMDRREWPLPIFDGGTI